jgi:hypothetical protein
MRRSLEILAGATLLALIVACAGPQLSQDASPDELKTRGIVVVSVTHDQASGARVAPVFYVNQRLGFDAAERRQLRSRETIAGIPVRSDFGDVYGQVYVLSMEPGTHQIDSWHTSGGNLRLSPRHPPPPLRFVVKAGEVIYLGNLNVNHETGRGLFGMPVLSFALPEVRDHRVIDIPVAENKAPLIKGKVVVNLLPLGAWHAGSIDTVQQVDQPPVYIPPAKK